MSAAKPRFRVIAGRPVQVPAEPASQVDKARARFGKAFAHEPGSTWERHATPVLTAWLATRTKERT